MAKLKEKGLAGAGTWMCPHFRLGSSESLSHHLSLCSGLGVCSLWLTDQMIYTTLFTAQGEAAVFYKSWFLLFARHSSPSFFFLWAPSFSPPFPVLPIFLLWLLCKTSGGGFNVSWSGTHWMLECLLLVPVLLFNSAYKIHFCFELYVTSCFSILIHSADCFLVFCTPLSVFVCEQAF